MHLVNYLRTLLVDDPHGELIEVARHYAIEAHGDQTYGTEPYRTHLDGVDRVLVEFNVVSPMIRAAGFLHDVVEDTAVTLEVLAESFPSEIIEIVDGVTKPKGIKRREQIVAYYPRIAETKERSVVKLADRIANMRSCLATNSSLAQMYRREYAEFRIALYSDNAEMAPMWVELDRLHSQQEIK